MTTVRYVFTFLLLINLNSNGALFGMEEVARSDMPLRGFTICKVCHQAYILAEGAPDSYCPYSWCSRSFAAASAAEEEPRAYDPYASAVSVPASPSKKRKRDPEDPSDSGSPRRYQKLISIDHCPCCGFVSKDKGLARHILCNCIKKIGNYVVCPVKDCSFSTVQKRSFDLLRHLIGHTGERNFYCKICGSGIGSPRMESARKHLREVHDKEGHPKGLNQYITKR